MAEHHRRREDRRVGVRQRLASYIRRRAVYGLVEAGCAGLAQRGRGQHAHRAREHGGLIREDVTEEVLGQHYVEPPRVPDQKHRGGIREHVVEPDVRVLTLYVVYDAPPQPACRHHVGLVDGGQVPLAPLRRLERHPRYPLYLLAGVGGEVACPIFFLHLLSEVGPARELPYDQDVHPLQDLGFERRGREQRRYRLHRPQVREHPQGLPELQEPGLRADRAPVEVRVAGRPEHLPGPLLVYNIRLAPYGRDEPLQESLSKLLQRRRSQSQQEVLESHL